MFSQEAKGAINNAREKLGEGGRGGYFVVWGRFLVISGINID